jgi:hypothetical protein
LRQDLMNLHANKDMRSKSGRSFIDKEDPCGYA